MDRIASELSISWCRPENRAIALTMALRELEFSAKLMKLQFGLAELQYEMFADHARLFVVVLMDRFPLPQRCMEPKLFHTGKSSEEEYEVKSA